MGGRKLWEAKDEKPWVHDLFEDLNVRDDSFSGEVCPYFSVVFCIGLSFVFRCQDRL